MRGTGDPRDTFGPFDLANGAADKISPPPDFDGPTRSRRITDPLCLLVLIGIWGVATWAGVWSLQKGDYNLFLHQTDYRGRICGVDKDANGDELPSLWHAVDHLSNGVCVDECPSTSNGTPSSRSDLICKDDDDLLLMQDCLSGGSISDDPDTLVTCGGCMYAMGVRQMKDECIPTSVSSLITNVNQAAKNRGLEPLSDWERLKLRPYITRFVRDLHTSIYIMIGGFTGSVLLSIVFLFMYIIPAVIPFTIWVSAGLVPCVLGGSGALLWLLSSYYDKDGSGIHSDLKSIAVKVLAILLWSLAGIVLISIIIMRQKINLTISLTKAATRAIREIRFCYLFPILQVVFYAAFLGIMYYWFINFSTTGIFSEETENVFGSDITYTIQKFSAFRHYTFWFLILVLIWTSAFFVSFGRLALSLSFADWYFTPEKDDGNSVSIFSCTITTLTKHAGTVAYASLAMGPIVVLRAPFLLFQQCIKASRMDNICIDAFICSCQCGFFVLERFLKFTSKNLYVQTAVFGYSFCKSSHESYYLVKRNERNICDAGPVGFLCTFFTKILLCAITCLGTYLVLDSKYGEELFSIISVTAMMGLISWFTVGFFMETVAMSVTTLFQCFLADEEMLGNEGSHYVPSEIDEFLVRLDEARKPEISVPKVVREDDEYTVESGMYMGSTQESGIHAAMS